MKNIIAIVSFAGMTLLPPGLAHCQFNAQSIQVPLYYNPASGNLTMDATDLPSGRLVSYSLNFRNSGPDHRMPGVPEFQPEGFTPFMGSVWADASEFNVGDHNASGVAAGVYSLGNLLPPDLDRATVDLMAGLTADTWTHGLILDALGTGYGHHWEIIYGESPFEPLNGDESWVPTYERWAESVTLMYDITNGQVAIDSTGERGGALSAFGLQFREDAPVHANDWTPIGDVSGFEDGLLSEFFTSGLPEGRYELGRLLPAGLSSDDLAGHLESSRFVGQPGHASPFSLDVNGEPLQIRVVPEPSGLATAALIVSLLVLTRRRNRTSRR